MDVLLTITANGSGFNLLPWQTGQGKLIEQQEARKTMDNIGRLLRQTAPDWVIDSTHYPVAISEQNTRIDFYQPIFDANGAIASLRKITFKINLFLK